MTSSSLRLAATAAFATAMAAAPSSYLVFFGTYTNAGSKGIYVSRFDPKTGSLSAPELAAETANPSWVTLHPSGRFLYAVSETGKSSIAAFAVDRSNGKLTKLNEVPAEGSSACHLAIDRAGKTIAVANYGDGSVSTFPIETDGKLGKRISRVQHAGSSVNAQRQRGPHAHAVVFSPDGKFLFVPDLGMDQYVGYKFNAATGEITPAESAKVKGGLGPRHFAFHPKGKLAFGLSEMGSAVTSFRYAPATGVLTEVGTYSNLAPDFTGTSNAAEIDVDRQGKFVYASNRGADTITVFKLDAKSGVLSPAAFVSTGGKTPRCFRIDPTGKWVIAANQDSNNVLVFRRDAKSGGLTPEGAPVELPRPVSIEFLALP